MSKLTTPPDRFAQGWLDQLDGRTGIAQTMRERWQALTDDLGGASRLSYQQRSLVSRVLWLEHHLIEQERALAAGGDFDSGKWVQSCNALSGIFSKLGLDRQARDVSLADLINRAKP
ncbi:hypothetical protein [Pseudomonas sp. OIL-1]|uniref:hypothetical protein n=1 Tax=Pseudomonas sp. OIL-1 TaxID=2706126 RepID=UPI0013A774A0|nr:hypothetical protein [Pseudomonas sp. OIL-1]QIB52134.1 hypothetical protein G3M63_14415 [Pseudomonas sp. OIL-1]